MYFLYCLFILVFVYITPALAIFPALISSPRLAVSIPILNALIVYLITSLLISIDFFDQIVVLNISAILGFIAFIRVKKYLGKSKMDWPRQDVMLIIVNLAIVLPFSAKIGTTSFGSWDEIYSWNMWAVQHFMGESPDFYYTQAPYPQLFPKFIAYCYKLLGSVELQMPVRALLVIFPFCMLTAITTISRNNDFKKVVMGILTSVCIVFGLKLNHYFDVGLADPVMSSCLVVSVAFYIHFQNRRDDVFLLLISVCCGIAAAFSKQPALLWTLFSLPVLVMWVKSNRNSKYVLLLLFISIFSSLYWVFGEGSGFQNNSGVIQKSFADRNYLQQLFNSMHEYFVKMPLFFVLFVVMSISLYRVKKFAAIYWVFLIPTLVIWFVFGAYSMRLGIHVVGVTALLFAASEYNIPIILFKNRYWSSVENYLQKHYKKISFFLFSVGAVNAMIIFIFQGTSFDKKVQKCNLYLGGKCTIQKHFGVDADFVYETLYNNSEILLWMPTNFAYGIFYGHTKMLRPASIDLKSFLYEIKENQPDYLLDAGTMVPFGPGSAVFRKAIASYPLLFDKVTDGPNKFGYKIYKLKKSELQNI